MQQELNAVSSLGDLPARLLVSGEFLRLVPDRELARRPHEQMLEMQQELARLSTRSELSVLEDSASSFTRISHRRSSTRSVTWWRWRGRSQAAELEHEHDAVSAARSETLSRPPRGCGPLAAATARSAPRAGSRPQALPSCALSSIELIARAPVLKGSV